MLLCFVGDLAGSKQAAGVKNSFGDVGDSLGGLKKGFWRGGMEWSGLAEEDWGPADIRWVWDKPE